MSCPRVPESFAEESCLVDSPFEGGQGDVLSFLANLPAGVLFFLRSFVRDFNLGFNGIILVLVMITPPCPPQGGNSFISPSKGDLITKSSTPPDAARRMPHAGHLLPDFCHRIPESFLEVNDPVILNDKPFIFEELPHC